MERPKPPPPVKYETDYGMIEIAAGGYVRGQSSVMRLDRFTPKDPTGHKGIDSIFATGERDMSPQHRGYDGRCSCCWLNFGHTILYHHKEISEAPKPLSQP